MSRDKTYTEASALAEHYKAIGQVRVWLDENDSSLPWDKVTSVSDGGMYRFNIPVSIHFTANDDTGLSYEWSVNLEPRSANGASTFKLDTELCKRISGLLPSRRAHEFSMLLASKAEALRKQADEYRATANRLYSDAHSLDDLANRS